jgi:dTDP-4-amino-4,6-dideoxygalactose transaminase
VHLFDDVHFSPVLATRLAKDTHDLVARRVSGIVNLPSADRISKFAFGVLLAEAFGFDPALVIRGSIGDRPDLVARPREMALTCDVRDRLLGRPALTTEQHVAELKELIDSGEDRTVSRSRTPYGRHRLEEEDIAAVSRVLRTGALTQGPKVDEFERALAEKVGAEYAVAVASGTAGLHLAAMVADLGPGKSLVTSPITFVATANAARYTGADVAFIDVDPDTVNLCPEQLAAHLKGSGRRTGAVTAVHLAGLSADMPRIRQAAASVGAVVIEDAAHALGGIDAEGYAVGSCRHSDMAVFSLHPVKSIAAGEGGVITTNDASIYRSLLRLRSHGINKADDGLRDVVDPVTGDIETPWRYEMQELGYNLRFTDIQSALALSQLQRLDSYIGRRRELAERYDALFDGHDVLTPLHRPWRDRSAHTPSRPAPRP